MVLQFQPQQIWRAWMSILLSKPVSSCDKSCRYFRRFLLQYGCWRLLLRSNSAWVPRWAHPIGQCALWNISSAGLTHHRRYVIVPTVANSPAGCTPLVLLSGGKTWRLQGRRKKSRKRQTAETQSRTTSALSVVCSKCRRAAGRAADNNLGTPLYGFAEGSDTVVIRAGTLDDPNTLSQFKPAVELYTGKRIDWLTPVEGATQFTGWPPSA